MNYAISLIDKAAKICGGQNALAMRLGFSSGTLSDMKHGRKAISPATAAELADIAGEDAREAAIDAVIASAQGTRRESTLRAILGKALAAGAVAMLGFSYNGDSIAAMVKIAKPSDSLYIVSTRWVRHWRALFRAACASLASSAAQCLPFGVLCKRPMKHHEPT